MERYTIGANITGNVNGSTLRGQAAAVSAANGLSAYEIAVREGFEGTVEEWLDSLQGGGGYELTEEDKAEIKESVIEELPVYDDEHQIIVRENGTTTLATAGMWCERDLEIVTNVIGGGTAAPILQAKTFEPRKETVVITPDSGYDGLASVIVYTIPNEYIIPSGTKSITTNGIHDVTDKASVNVNVPIPEGYITPSGSLEITENGTYDVTDKASAVVNIASGGGNLVEYSGTTWCGTSIGYPETTSFTIDIGAEIPEKFHFYAMNWLGFMSANTVPQIMRGSDGSCRLLQVTTNNLGGITSYLISRVDTDSYRISVSADRRSIIYTPPSGTTWSGGNWYWTLIAEG